MVGLRPLLRLFAHSVDSMEFVDSASDASFGALMAARRKAELGAPIVESIMSGKSTTSAALAIFAWFVPLSPSSPHRRRTSSTTTSARSASQYSVKTSSPDPRRMRVPCALT